MTAAGTAALLVAACGGSDGGSATSIADWCSFAAEAETVDAVFDSLGGDPTQVEPGIKQVKSLAEQLEKRAPDEVKADAKKLSEGTLRLVKSLEDADYSLLDADLSFLDDGALNAELEEASAGLDTFTVRECGRPFGASDTSTDEPGAVDAGTDPSTDSGDDGFDPNAGTLREQLVTQFESIGLTTPEANCIADNLDFNDPSVQSGDIASMLDVFGACGIGLERLGELGGG